MLKKFIDLLKFIISGVGLKAGRLTWTEDIR
jgi:hypothetical protein